MYGDELDRPYSENDFLLPITSYGMQKLVIEKFLHYYYHVHGLDYRIIRLSNPYGPLQIPNSGLGALTTFTYQAVVNNPITIYGDGSAVRDYIFIEDVIKGVKAISCNTNSERIFNLGSGVGTSLKQILEKLALQLGRDINVKYLPKRSTDVKYSVLDTTRYKKINPEHKMLKIDDGIKKMVDFFSD